MMDPKRITKRYIFLCLLLLLFIKRALTSSIESCLSAYGVDLAQPLSANATLPVECQCSEVELVCTNSAINNPQVDDSNFPTLSILFDASNSSIFYPLPKHTLTFWGYRTLIPNAFKGFKFVNAENEHQLTDETVHIYFSESYRFPRGTFNSFGNLQAIDKRKWPRVNIEIVDNDFNNILSFEQASFGEMRINTMSVKYAGPAAYFLANAWDDATVERLEIKNSPNFMGFISINDDDDENTLNGTVTSLLIDNCPSFIFNNNNTLPKFTHLTYLTIKSSNLLMLPPPATGFWTKFDSLLALSLIGNQISFVSSFAFAGLEKQLLLLDLSYNPITNLDWTVFENFSSLLTLDLSFTSITTINSFVRTWPNPSGLKTILLKGYNNTFDNRTICAFDHDVAHQRINLSTTFVQVERTYQCDCFLFYIYKDYRKNPNNLLTDWLFAERTPMCYENLFKISSQNFSLIEQHEEACNFGQILNLFCPKSTIGTKSYVTTTTPCFSTQFSQPGQTTIIIGNQTSFSATTTPCIPFPSSNITPLPTSSTSTNLTTTTTTYSTYDSTARTRSTTRYYSETTTKPALVSTNSSSNQQQYDTTTYTTITNKAGPSASSSSSVSSTQTSPTTVRASPVELLPESSTALPSLDASFVNSSSLFNTTSIIVIVVLSVVSLLLLLIILGLIIYFRNRLRSVSNSSGGGGGPTSIISPSSQVIIDQKGNKHIYRV